MQLDITYDMRAPSFGAPARELYAAALDQVQWADELGFDNVGLGEHHGSPDGYNPSPLVLAAATPRKCRRLMESRVFIVLPVNCVVELLSANAAAPCFVFRSRGTPTHFTSSIRAIRGQSDNPGTASIVFGTGFVTGFLGNRGHP